MSHTYQLEIKTFTISEGLKRSTLSAKEIAKNIFNLNEDDFNNTSFIEAFKSFIESGFEENKEEDGFIVNEALTKKYRVEELHENIAYSSFFGIYIGGVFGERGRFNKKTGATYLSQKMGVDDFTDIPFMFYIHFPVDS